MEMNLKPFRYATNVAPEGYECGQCKASGVKLWREYNTFLEHQMLYCAPCACQHEKVPMEVDRFGKRPTKHGPVDQIGWLVPAVPTEEGDTFWGYSSVPPDGVEWWRSLPTLKTEQP